MFRLPLAILLCLSTSAWAQTAPPYTPPTQTYSATTTSGGTAAALPSFTHGIAPYAVFYNSGSVNVSYALGNTSGITVTPGATIPVIKAGGCQVVFVGAGGYIAVQTGSSTASLIVTLQLGGSPLPVACP